jgi:hypothetical protein
VLNGKGESVAHCIDTCSVTLPPARYTVQVRARGRAVRDDGLTVTQDAEYKVSPPASSKGTDIVGGVIIGFATLYGLAVSVAENVELCGADSVDCRDHATYYGPAIIASGAALGTVLILGGRQPAPPTMSPLKTDGHRNESERATVSLGIGRVAGGAVLSLSGRF